MNISKALNQMMNAKRASKKTCTLLASSLLCGILDIMKKNSYVDYKLSKEEGKFEKVIVEFKELNVCKAITPRFYVKLKKLDRYIKRFLPSRHLGVVILSTSQGLLTHNEAIERGIGGSLIAYCY